MAKYLVGIREVHVWTVEVEAGSEEEALLVEKCEVGRDVMTEYSHTLDKETWSVEKIEEDR